MVVSWLPFLQTKSRSFYTTQSLVRPFIVSGGRRSSHPKAFWNWSHDWLRNGASLSSVALRWAWAGKAERRRQAATAGWAESPLAQPRPPERAAAATLWARSAPGKCGQLPRLSEMLKEAKTPQLPTLLQLSKARLVFAVRSGTGEGETCPTISRHPVSTFRWGQGGSSRQAQTFSPAYSTLILEFCLH